jgi:hypothetical protein
MLSQLIKATCDDLHRIVHWELAAGCINGLYDINHIIGDCNKLQTSGNFLESFHMIIQAGGEQDFPGILGALIDKIDALTATMSNYTISHCKLRTPCEPANLLMQNVQILREQLLQPDDKLANQSPLAFACDCNCLIQSGQTVKLTPAQRQALQQTLSSQAR